MFTCVVYKYRYRSRYITVHRYIIYYIYSKSLGGAKNIRILSGESQNDFEINFVYSYLVSRGK